MFDVDDENDKDNLSKQEIIGIVEVEFNELVYNPEGIKKDIQSHIKGNKKKQPKLGRLIMKAYESDICQTRVKFLLAVEEIATRNQLMVSIKASSNNKEYMMIHNTPKRKNTANGCVFPEFSVNSNKIGEDNSTLKFEFYEIKKSVQKILGELEISLIGLYNNNNKKISIFRNNLVVGKLRATLTKDDHNNFLNYISDGYCLKLIVGVDYCVKTRQTEYDNYDTHTRKIMNLYKKALMDIGGLLKYYDDDPRTVALGFGAKLPPEYNVVSHCFALNGDYFHPEVDSLEQYSASAVDGESSHSSCAGTYAHTCSVI